MRVLFGHHGLRGDLAINLPAITFLSEQFGWDIDMPINRRFAEMTPLFLNHPHLRSVVVSDEYDTFPSVRDGEMLKSRSYDRVYSPMQPHRSDRWFESLHQVEAVLYDYIGMKLPQEYRQIRLTKWWNDAMFPEKVVAFSPFAGFESNPDNDKRLSVARAQEVVDYLRHKSYVVLQMGGPTEPRLDGTTPLIGSYTDSIRSMLRCRALITGDTGAVWYASAYQFPTLGLYGHRYYTKRFLSHIQPINPNALYLDASTVADIPMDQIKVSIDHLLS